MFLVPSTAIYCYIESPGGVAALQPPQLYLYIGGKKFNIFSKI